MKKTYFCRKMIFVKDMFINFNEKQTLEFNPTIFFFLKYVLKLHELWFFFFMFNTYI